MHHVDDLGIRCPKGHTELTASSMGKPIVEARWMIRPYKVADENGHWWSECMVCAGVIDADGNSTGNLNTGKGWYCNG